MATREPWGDLPSDDEIQRAKEEAEYLANKLALMSIDSYLKALAIDNLQDLSVYTLKCFGGVNIYGSKEECLERFEKRYKRAKDQLKKIMQDNQENSV